MNNMSSYCGLVDAKIRASDKDLPVQNNSHGMYCKICQMTKMLENSCTIFLGLGI